MQKSKCLITTGVSQEVWIKRTLEKCRVQLLQEKRQIIIIQREEEEEEESEVEGGGMWYWGRKESRWEEDRLIKGGSHQQRKREKAPAKLAKGSQGLSLRFAFHLHGWPYRPIGLGAQPRGLGRRIKTPNAFTALIPRSHNTLSALLFSRSLSLSLFSPRCHNTLSLPPFSALWRGAISRPCPMW